MNTFPPQVVFIYGLLLVAGLMHLAFFCYMMYAAAQALFSLAKYLDAKGRAVEQEMITGQSGAERVPLPSWATAPRPAADEGKYMPKS